MERAIVVVTNSDMSMRALSFSATSRASLLFLKLSQPFAVSLKLIQSLSGWHLNRVPLDAYDRGYNYLFSTSYIHIYSSILSTSIKTTFLKRSFNNYICLNLTKVEKNAECNLNTQWGHEASALNLNCVSLKINYCKSLSYLYINWFPDHESYRMY